MKEITMKEFRPKRGQYYFIPFLGGERQYQRHKWIDGMYDNAHFYRGLVFKTKEEAILKYKELNNIK